MTSVLEGYRLSPQQRRLWTESQGDPAFRAQCALRLHGELDAPAFLRALETVVARNEILRTVFESLPGMGLPVQVVIEGAAIPCPQVDLSGYGTEEQEWEIATLRRRMADDRFAFSGTPPARFELVRLACDRHVLLICLPALCADSRTLDNLAAEIAQVYGAAVGAAEVGEEPVQYIQFSEWQNELQGEPASQAGRQFWRERPLPPEEGLMLPWEGATGGPSARDAASPSTAGVTETLTPGLARAAAAAAATAGVSFGAYLLAAWQTLLGRLSSRDELVVWSLFDGRKFAELKSSLGLFTSYLPLHVRLRPTETLGRLAARTEEVLQAAARWQEHFDAEGWPTSAVVGFDFEELPATLRVGDLELAVTDRYTAILPCKLRLAAAASGERTELTLCYDPRVYPQRAATRLLARFCQLLESAVGCPETPLWELPLLPPEELRHLVDEGSRTAAEYPRERCVHELFEEQVRRTPEASAVVCNGESLSYAELNGWANRLAHRLRQGGIGPEARVGLCLDSSIDLVIAVLGVLKAGAAFLPLDPAQPAERQAKILADAGASLLVARSRLLAGLPTGETPVLALDDRQSALGPCSPDDATGAALPQSLAYVIYTSGSTGRPKGVLICHRSAVNLAFALRETVYAGAAAGLRVSVNAPLSFDAAIKQVLQLLWGHTLYLVPEEVRRDGEELLGFLTVAGLDVVDCTPSQLELLLAAGLLDRSSAGRFLIGGEAISQPLWRTLAGRPEIAFWNVYGPTECTVDATVRRVDPLSPPVIGRPLANVHVYVVDESGCLAAEGVAGELWIGGVGVARGYLGRPDLTAERFVPDPFGGEAGERLYRTGDLVRWEASGSLEFIGRVDHQVKVRGVRVELGEIESVLVAHPALSAAAVAQGGDGRLVGYVVPRRQGKGRYRLPNGLWVAQQNRNETDYLYEEIFVKQIYLGRGLSLPADACVFDVGANIGMFTLFVQQVCPRSRVYAFEPVGPIFANLESNTEACRERVKPFAYGLADREGSEEFLYYRRYSMMSGVARYATPGDEVEVIKRYLTNQGREGGEEARQLLEEADDLLAGRFEGDIQHCRLRRLSQVLREEGVERIDLLKVDVQRTELAVLRGIDDADWRRIDQIVLEVHDAPGRESEGRLAELVELLAGHGYRVEVEQDDLLVGTDRYNMYAQRPDRRPGEVTQGVQVPPVEAPELELRALREYLRERLPEVMVPSLLVKLERLPLTRNGKLDRSALPPPEDVEDAGEGEPTAARTPFEEIVGALFEQVLGVERVGVEESFFDLGGHSLLATQLMSRVREAFQVELPLRVLFEAPTVAELALRVEDALGKGEGRAPVPPLVRVPRDGELPLSFAQQRLWFLQQLAPASTAYNIPIALRLTGQLDPALLAASLSAVVERHESLRTVFPAVVGRPAQELRSAALTAVLPLIDLSALPAVDRETELRCHAAREAAAPFDLARGPLLRTRLLRLGAEDHGLLFSMHHIISDAWSLRVLIREVSALYEAFSRGLPSPLPELPIQYADYAAWQRSWLQGEALAASLAYWHRSLSGAPALELPTDRPRPAVPTERGARAPVRVDGDVTAALRGLCRQQGVTMFMAVRSAFAVLLGRWSGQTDFCVGTPVAGRNQLATEPLIGFFVNALVLRSDLSGAPTFLDVLGQTREVTLGAYTHQELPFERLVEELNPVRSLSWTPLFQVLLDFRSGVAKGLELGGLSLSEVQEPTRRAKFDLELDLADLGGDLGGVVEHATDLFDETTIVRLLAHLATVLAAMVSRPEERIWELPLLSTGEWEQVVAGWKRMRWELPPGGLLDQIRAWVERDPAAVAVAGGAEALSYGELWRRSEQWAAGLVARGLRPEEVVALVAPRGVRFLVALLGIWKAGGVYLPLDPEHPALRLQEMLAQSGARLVISPPAAPGALAEALERLGGRVQWVSWEQLESGAGGDREAWPQGDLAYVIFTSGSTGRPKGAMVEHRGMLNHLWGKVRDLELGRRDVVAQTASQSFDISVWQLLAALLVGGRVEVVGEAQARDPQRLLLAVEERRITVLELVPSMLGFLLEEVERLGSSRPPLTALRFLMATGEELSAGLCRRWLAAYPAIPLVNAYGPTECSDDVTHQLIAEAPAAERERVPIGVALPNLQLYVVDRGWNVVPEGLGGELWVGGDGVGRGYVGEPAQTAAAFVPDGLSGAAGGRLYRTGDRVRWRRGGVFEYLGRLDHQVKVRGFRIELGEIESTLASHPAMRQCAVVVREEAGEPRLVAYVVGEQLPADRELRHWLRLRLPLPMVPTLLVRLPELPLTANGKLDRQALPWMEGEAGEAAGEAPRTLTEDLLAEIWKPLLGRERIQREESFFDLGGHSLLATQVLSRMREAFGVELPLRALFEEPTLAGLARRVEEALETGSDRPLAPPLLAVPRDQEPPLSFAQQRLWFLDQLTPGSPAYNIPAAIRLSGTLDAGALERAFSELVRRHEVLRCRFVQHRGRPQVAITPPPRTPLPLVDLAALTEPARNIEVERLSLDTARAPFDLEQGPLWRIRLVRLASREHWVLVTMHHAVSDAWSTGIMLREIAELYAAFAAGEPSPLPELPIQYLDFAVWQRRWLQGEALEAELAHWRRRLEGAPPLLELPTDRPRPAVRSDRGARVTFALPATLVSQLWRVTRGAGVTLFMTLLAAFKVLLSHSTGRSDILVGTPVAGRNRLEIEGLIGLFVNTLVLRVDLSGALPFHALLERLREVALEAQAHQDLPFEKLVDELRLERVLSHSPLFQVLFVLQNAPREELKLPGLRLSTIASDSGTAKFDLTLSVAEAGDRLVGFLGYNRDLFDRSTIERLLQHWTVLLEGAAAAPERQVTSLPILTSVERQQLQEWTETPRRPLGELAVHELFELQAARSPEAVAVAFEGEQLLYRDLDGRANQLARYLRRLGVGRESRVGILLDRTPAMVVAVLAVLKAGASYVPLQPGQPSERLKHILQDTGAAVVLTRGALAPAPAEDGPRVLRLDLDWSLVAREDADSPGCTVALENSAYVLYTSGSTGLPKGVVIEHRQLLSYLEAIETRLDLAAGASFAMLQPLTVDSCKTVLFPPLIRGGCLHLISEERALNAEALGEYFQRAGIDCLKVAPSHLAALLAATAEPHRLMPRRWLVIGGEALHWELARSLPVPAGCRLFNHYGPTETTVGITAHGLRADIPPAHHSATVPLGRPLGGARLWVLDANLQPVEIGVPGELYAGGDAVARGYLHRPELTAERFVPDLFGPEPGGRLYRTGDRVRWLPDGALEFLGRFDHQVKIRGFRIELGEISAVLERHPRIAEAVVVARDAQERQRLIAYFVATEAGAPPTDELREYLAARLPDYMLPAFLVELTAFPRTPHGKIALQALPQAPAAEVKPEVETAAPRHPVEATLAAIWAQVLGRERVGIHDNFFRLGGDSIQSIQIVARANESGLRLTPRQLFQHQTVAELSRVVGVRTADEVAEPLSGPLPLLPSQRRFFAAEPDHPHHFNQSLLLGLERDMAPATLARAFAGLLAHHDALRLRFHRQEGEWWQEQPPAGPESGLVVVDLAGLPSDTAAVAALEAAAEHAQASLDLTAGPLLRAVLFRRRHPQTDRLLIVVHHLAIDGVSWRILLADLEAACRQLQQEGEAVPPPKTSSLRRWSERLQEHARSPAVRGELGFWTELSRRAEAWLPVDLAGRNSEGSAAMVTVALDEEETRALLEDLPATYRTGINDVLLTAVSLALTRWAATRSVLIDLEGHGREEIADDLDLSRTVGWLTTVYPVLLEPGDGSDLVQAMLRVKEQLHRIPQRGLGYGLLRYLSDEQTAAEMAALPRPQVIFNYQGRVGGEGWRTKEPEIFSLAAESKGSSSPPGALRPYLLEVNGAVAQGRLRLGWRYSTQVHGAASIERLAEELRRALSGLIAACRDMPVPALSPEDFPLVQLAPSELEKIASRIGKGRKAS
jgi:amino acid adenylation domain-containing protein/non-ribosomal peptide synthase protein (TIGR01720 family)/FkbM family methyltransferase